ncbi:MAG: T9SS type A sorting domain-containing protein [Bacteroidetes bacterium]|nr:T9SS type A sorting domain-containing protein [Bacteroidota bacterium]
MFFIVTMVALLTTQSSAVTKTWSGGAIGDWGNGFNWTPNGVPGSGDDVVISSSASITNGSATTINSITVSSAATIISDYQITVGNTTISAPLYLEYESSTGNVNGINILSITNLNLSGTIERGSSWTTSDVRISISGTITMSGIASNFIGTDVYTNIGNENALQSHVRFEGDINLPNGLVLGNYDLYIGIDADVLTPNAVVGSAGDCIETAGDNSNPAGTVRKQYTAVGDEFTFNVSPGSNRLSPITIKIIAPTSSSKFTSATPWPHISVRVVYNSGGNGGHPENQQNQEVWVHWPVKGFGIDEPVYLSGEMTFSNTYRSGQPDELFSARYAPHYEDAGSTGGWDLTGTVQVTTTSGNLRSVPFDGFPGFGDFTVGQGNPFGGDPIPVELTSFSARFTDDAVRLNWKTATELNNYGFAIERSTDRERWEEVGFMEGHGTSNSPKSYAWTDRLDERLTRLPELAYRLRQIDRDGTTEYSNIVLVNTGALPEGVELYAAYPNPFNPATTISFSVAETANVTLRVYNALGQVVATLLEGSAMDAGLHTMSFNAETLPSGLYMAVIEAGGALQQQKLVLNK